MALRVFVEVSGNDDVDLVAGVEVEGAVATSRSKGPTAERDRVATGWQAASLRALDERVSAIPAVPTFARSSRWHGQVEAVDIALGPSSTLFRAGEQLRLVLAGRWVWPRNPLTGQFPAACRTQRRGTCPRTGDRNARAGSFSQ